VWIRLPSNEGPSVDEHSERTPVREAVRVLMARRSLSSEQAKHALHAMASEVGIGVEAAALLLLALEEG
jgi:hypothetical protein